MSFNSTLKPIGNGRSVMLLTDLTSELVKGNEANFSERLAQGLMSSSTVHQLSIEKISHEQVEECTREVIKYLEQEKIRQVSIITIGKTSTLLWKLALLNPRLIRNALVVNGETRPESNKFERALERVEAYLPLGLPFRSPRNRFYALPFLSRIRFPVIVIDLINNDHRLKQEAERLAIALPVAWLMKPEGNISDIAQKVDLVVNAFEKLKLVPAKRPQKRRKVDHSLLTATISANES